MTLLTNIAYTYLAIHPRFENSLSKVTKICNIMQHSVINEVETSRTTFCEPQSEFGGGVVEITTC